MDNNERTKLNHRLAKIAGMNNIALGEGCVYASNPDVKSGGSVFNISSNVDFTRDWNLTIPLAIKLGVSIDWDMFVTMSEDHCLDMCLAIIQTVEQRAYIESVK